MANLILKNASVMQGDVLPDTDSTRSIGSSSEKWNSTYTESIYVNDGISTDLKPDNSTSRNLGSVSKRYNTTYVGSMYVYTSVFGNLIPTTTGTQLLGSSESKWANVYVNELYTETITVADVTGGGLLPSGAILIWSGSIETIPDGWALCDGSNSTPDLRNLFVTGSGDTYTIGDTGGSVTVTLDVTQLPAHQHTATDMSTDVAGEHFHRFSDGPWGGKGARGGDPVIEGGGFSDTYPTSKAGLHSHTLAGETGSAGSGNAHDNLPPYYALAYIMKI